ncbi:MAG: heme lyase CcmF/NrfE family subunit [Rickettsiaceae bacterium]|nr:heme lyase CcmF/NrfE family subunit [Rickettsiaceae bacterium]
MISSIGNFLLILAILTPLISIFINIFKTRIYYIGSLLPIISFILLVVAFIISDLSIKNVFFNSSLEKPLIYRISASWASHEGSMLLWLSFISIMGMIFIHITTTTKGVKDLAIILLSFIQLLFTCFLYFTSNPFDSFNFTPNDGLGLNPLLQDVALAIHPPILYLGISSLLIPFITACLILIHPAKQNILLQKTQIFTNFSLMTLSTGIGLGAWWAYRELGWGGYWFFDPVENISLMPWLCAIALHHFLLITVKKQKYLQSVIILSALAFLLTLYGMFFVRSGIVSSVHSFAFSKEKGVFIFSICLILTILFMLLFLFKRSRLSSPSTKSTIKEKFICYGNIIWLISLVTILISIIYPIYYDYRYDEVIAIDPDYFTKVFLPLNIPLLLLAAITPYLSKLKKITITYLILSLVIVILLNSYLTLGIISNLILFAAIYLMLQMSHYLLLSSNFCKTIPKPKNLALFLSHFGFGLLALSITLNVAMQINISFTGIKGETITNQEITVKLNDVKFAENPSYLRQIVEFWITDKADNMVILKPENRLYKVENSLSQEVDIYSFLTHDVYAVLGQIKEDTINAEIHYNPMISFIWLACFLIASGFAITVFAKPKEMSV